MQEFCDILIFCNICNDIHPLCFSLQHVSNNSDNKSDLESKMAGTINFVRLSLVKMFLSSCCEIQPHFTLNVNRVMGMLTLSLSFGVNH